MRNVNSRTTPLVILALASLLALFVLAGCSDDSNRDMAEMMMPEPMGYKVTITNNLSDEYLAPIVVTHASNDGLLFDGDNYVTMEAEYQILKGVPTKVLKSIGDAGGYAVADHGMEPKPDDPDARVLLGPGQSLEIMFEQEAGALRILAMVAPTILGDDMMPIYPDNFVSAVADVPMEEPVPLSRFDIGHNEGTMEIRLTAENAGTVTIERVGEAMADDGNMMDTATYTVEVMNDLAMEFFAPIVVTRVNDEHYLFDGTSVTAEAEHQILFGGESMVLDAIGKEDAVSDQGTDGPGFLLGSGKTLPIPFSTDATALRIIAMVAPTMVPDNYVSAVVNVASLMPGDSVTAPLTRFDIGHDEAVSDHAAEMPDHHGMSPMVHRHGDMMTDIMLVDDDMTVGTVTITRQ